MKQLLLFFVLVSFISFVNASTNCSTGCDVTGGTFFDTNIDYLNWNNSTNDASLKIKSANGNVVATKSTGDIINWGNSQLMPFYPQIDGNYSLEVFSQGTDNNYQLKLDFNSLGVLSSYLDTNCTGTGCGGSTKIYKLNVSNSPTTIFDDNHSLPVLVRGGTGVAMNIRFFEGANCGALGSPCDVSMAIRRLSDNNIVAYKNAGGWSDWLNSTLLDWNADYDGNYVFEIFYEGGISRYDANITFTDANGLIRQFQDYSQYIGSSLATGQTTQYFFQVISSPPLAIHDEQTFSPAVKGATIMNASIKFYDGHNCGTLNSPCDVSIGIRRLSDSNRVAYKTDGSWSNWGSPVTLDWLADYNDSYVIEIFYEGIWGQYDLNVSYLDINNVAHLYSDTNQYIGSGLGTGNTTRYLFSVQAAPSFSFDDGKSFATSVKGGDRLVAAIKFYDGHNCGALNSPCDVSIGIRRISDNNIVAYRSDGSWNNWTSTTLDWYPDYDGAYVIEVFYEGTWGQYDLNVTYTAANDANTFESDNYSYIGSGLATGNTAQYFFTVESSPAQLLEDAKTIPYNAISNQPFSATIKMYDGHACGALNSPCDATFAIKDTNGATTQLISTGDYSTLNNTTIQFNPVANHAYFVETTYQGTWVQFDLNVNYTDTAGIARHLEDKTRYVGSGLATGGTTQHYFESGESCGNGITCAAPACKPVILNGPSSEKIDVVFVGSGFPDLNSFGSVVDDMIDYDGNGFGIMHYEPFSNYKDKFNFWKVNTLPTFSGGNVQRADGNWVHDGAYENESLELAYSECGSIGETPMQVITLLVNPKVQSHAYAIGAIGYGRGQAFVTVGQEYLDNSFPLFVPNYLYQPNPVLVNGSYGANRGEVQKQVVHEFGHSFGGLMDEYSTSNSTITSSLFAPNCADNFGVGGYACNRWANICPQSNPVCCLPGCTYSNYYHAYENTIMNNLFEDSVSFMPVNEFELEKDINSYNVITTQISNLSYLLNFNQHNSTFNTNYIDIISQRSYEPVVETSGQYRLVVNNNNGNVLYDVNFVLPGIANASPSKDWFDANGQQIYFPDIPADLNIDVNVTMLIPYFMDANTIQIFDNNSLPKLTVDLSVFAPKINYSIGNGGNTIAGGQYQMSYTISGQPLTQQLTSTNYMCNLGPTFFNN
ncbi:MAG: hypothetical protein IPJ89_01595 [Candidatus Iainarchaeum archaeon]|uniref:Uncharacterized protein n=1 Tax=Candidatus Iainarchaeum sp. TaxID=3101447 RepID=A0A7T9DKE8_9ARCH|nr:MAG: hypothetical protein IPJ89_01595 [Candidatus Diapherotrites archaeon]